MDLNTKLIEVHKAYNELLKELLFWGEADIPDDMLNEVRNYAEYLMWKNSKKRRENQ